MPNDACKVQAIVQGDLPCLGDTSRVERGAVGLLGWRSRGLVRSPITGPAGNVEFLLWLGKAGEAADIDVLIERAMAREERC